jgi:hypothetical protein
MGLFGMGKEAREKRDAEKNIRRDSDDKPVECDCGEWPGPCNGTGWCRR